MAADGAVVAERFDVFDIVFANCVVLAGGDVVGFDDGHAFFDLLHCGIVEAFGQCPFLLREARAVECELDGAEPDGGRGLGIVEEGFEGRERFRGNATDLVGEDLAVVGLGGEDGSAEFRGAALPVVDSGAVDIGDAGGVGLGCSVGYGTQHGLLGWTPGEEFAGFIGFADLTLSGHRKLPRTRIATGRGETNRWNLYVIDCR